MRLSDESTAKFEIELVNKQVQKIKQAKKDCQTHYGKQLGCGTCKALQLCMWIDELVDTIEAMRKHIEALQAENEQLQAQLESLRCTSCGEIPATIGTDDGQYCEKCAEELDAVEVIDLLSYHNPADVEALRKAREAIKAAWSDGSANAAMDKANKALAEIDKAIGGKEDV